jgi:hypothetical protein
LPLNRSKKPNNFPLPTGPEFIFFCPDAAFCQSPRMILYAQIKGNDLIKEKRTAHPEFKTKHPEKEKGKR